MRAKWRALKSGCCSVLKKCLTGATVLEMDVKRPSRRSGQPKFPGSRVVGHLPLMIARIPPERWPTSAVIHSSAQWRQRRVLQLLFLAAQLPLRIRHAKCLILRNAMRCSSPAHKHKRLLKNSRRVVRSGWGRALVERLLLLV